MFSSKQSEREEKLHLLKENNIDLNEFDHVKLIRKIQPLE